MRELSDIERMVDDFERNATERAAKFEQMRQQVEQISITESAASGAVSVTVGNNGIPTDVRMTEAVSRTRSLPRRLRPDWRGDPHGRCRRGLRRSPRAERRSGVRRRTTMTAASTTRDRSSTSSAGGVDE